jgi:BAI1-associated protein 3
MSAKHLPPMNLDGKPSDVYVKVMLLPENLFPGMKKLKTKIKKKTLFPMFDESFVVPLSRAQRDGHDSIIHFKVNGHEGFTMTTQKHHIGDGFLGINQVDEWQSDVTQQHLKLSRASRIGRGFFPLSSEL